VARSLCGVERKLGVGDDDEFDRYLITLDLDFGAVSLLCNGGTKKYFEGGQKVKSTYGHGGGRWLAALLRLMRVCCLTAASARACLFLRIFF